MESESKAAWAALGIAVAAMFIALAQALQQYFITGQLIRLCDSVVFGGLPGQGRRIWKMSQFRFRVMYRVPQIGLPPDLWPSSAAQSFSEMRMALPEHVGGLPDPSANCETGRLMAGFRNLSRLIKKSSGPREAGEVGIASWAAFCKTVYFSCHASIRYSFVEGDADRCPTDIPTVPMQMSLRDAIVMGLMVGMECTTASFDRGSVSMQGAAGTITSAQHPVLGPMIHFTPRDTSGRLGIRSTGNISKDWLWRVMGNCIVSRRQYNWRRRRWVEATRARINKPPASRHDEENDKPTAVAAAEGSSRSGGRGELGASDTPLGRMQQDGAWRLVTRDAIPLLKTNTWGSHRRRGPTDLMVEDAQPDFRPPVFSWELQNSPVGKGQPFYTRMSRKDLSLETLDVFGHDYELDKDDPRYVIIHRWVTKPEQDLLWRHTKVLRETKRMESGHIRPDNDSTAIAPVARGSKESHDATRESTKIYIPQSTHGEGQSTHEEEQSIHEEELFTHDEELFTHEDEQRMREEEDQYEWTNNSARSDSCLPASVQLDGESSKASSDGKADHPSGIRANSSSVPGTPASVLVFRDESEDRRVAEERALGANQDTLNPLKFRDKEVSLFASARPGNMSWFWLSQTDIIPGFWATPWRSISGLTPQTCIAAVAVFIEALSQRMGDTDGIQYLEYDTPYSVSVLSDTIDDMKRGTRTYPAYAFRSNGGIVCTGTYATISHKAFHLPIPAVDLLGPYQHQVNGAVEKSQGASEGHLVELMRLDAWLSLVGRMAEIRKGRGQLIMRTPALVQELMDHFKWRLFDADLTSESEREDLYERLGSAVIAWLTSEDLSEAEVLYAVVAALRTVKVGQAVLTGADTRMIIEILEKDVQVHLV
ncbi:hypothetical protein SLS62_008367 [Diatrype stigma]|uniref:Uncharacterized protein n=1 Tax=Diatrype stigma TaxID=117547 RepID=A0AAN9UJT0_9PEZI